MKSHNLSFLRTIVTLIALVLAFTHAWLPDLSIDHITLVLLAFAIIPWLSPLIKSFEAPGGWKIVLQEEVNRGLEVAAMRTLQRLAALDVQLIEYWEKDHMLAGEESAERLAVLEDTANHLESELAKAGQLEKLGIGLALRDVYWEYLNRAREHHASSKPYHEIKNRVLRGLKAMDHSNAPSSSTQRDA